MTCAGSEARVRRFTQYQYQIFLDMTFAMALGFACIRVYKKEKP